MGRLSAPERSWIELHNYAAKPGSYLIVSGADGALAKVYFGLGEDGADRDPFEFGKLSRLLPAAEYRIDGAMPDARLVRPWLAARGLFASIAIARAGHAPARLQCPKDVDRKDVLSAAEATGLVRDLINTPASDLGPAELETGGAESRRPVQSQVQGGLRAASWSAIFR